MAYASRSLTTAVVSFVNKGVHGFTTVQGEHHPPRQCLFVTGLSRSTSELELLATLKHELGSPACEQCPWLREAAVAQAPPRRHGSVSLRAG